jgi:hypothetical protein
MLRGLADTLASLASFMGAERITIERVTPARLHAALRGQVATVISRPDAR